MKNGLKGVTDATVFCKSMQKGGPAPMIRSMKSYAVGGATDVMSECAGPGGPGKKKCKQKFRSKGKSQESKGGIGGLIGALAAGTGAALWMKKQKEK